jgi:anti-sigma regulatory factor (Ser/Thr protein kinase)
MEIGTPPTMLTVEIPVTESSQVGEARRAATRLAEALNFAETDTGRVAIVATELASNVLKHGGGGFFLASASAGSPVPAVDLIAIDRGPGIADLSRALRDGYSTAGSPGTGLGAVQRQADFVDIHSAESLGTAVLARIARTRTHEVKSAIGALSAPRPGEFENGDGWVLLRSAAALTAVVVDGLGHGPSAKQASDEARRVSDSIDPDTPPVELLERIHDALRSTRGAAAAAARVEEGAHRIRFCGLGNVSATVVSGGVHRSAVSMHGTAGHQMRGLREFQYEAAAGSLLIMHTDGLSARWDLGRYSGIELRDPALIAALLWRDFRRPNDDATVVILRL